jgi:hypothetical protein
MVPIISIREVYSNDIFYIVLTRLAAFVRTI